MKLPNMTWKKGIAELDQIMLNLKAKKDKIIKSNAVTKNNPKNYDTKYEISYTFYQECKKLDDEGKSSMIFVSAEKGYSLDCTFGLGLTWFVGRGGDKKDPEFITYLTKNIQEAEERIAGMRAALIKKSKMESN